MGVAEPFNREKIVRRYIDMAIKSATVANDWNKYTPNKDREAIAIARGQLLATIALVEAMFK